MATNPYAQFLQPIGPDNPAPGALAVNPYAQFLEPNDASDASPGGQQFEPRQGPSEDFLAVPHLDAQGSEAPLPQAQDVRDLQRNDVVANFIGRQVADQPNPLGLDRSNLVTNAVEQPSQAFDAKFGQGAAARFEDEQVPEPQAPQGGAPYGQGLMYAANNWVTRGVAQGMSGAYAAGAEALSRVVAPPFPRAGQFLDNQAQQAARIEATESAPADAGLMAKGTQVVGNIGTQILGAVATTPIRAVRAVELAVDAAREARPIADTVRAVMQNRGNRIAANLGVQQASNEAAQLEANGQTVSNTQLGALALADTTANRVALSGRLRERIVRGVASSEGANEANNAITGQPLGTGAGTAVGFGALLSVAPGGREATLADHNNLVARQVRFDGRMNAFKNATARQDLEQRVNALRRPATSEEVQAIANQVADHHGVSINDIFQAPATPADAGARDAETALNAARSNADAATPGLAAAPARQEVGGLRANQEAAPVTTAAPMGAVPDTNVALGTAVPEPKAPTLPSVPEGATREDLIQQWRDAKSETDRANAAATIMAFDQHTQQVGTETTGVAPSRDDAPTAPAPYDWQTPLAAHPGLNEPQRAALGARYRRAQHALPGFTQALHDIATSVGGRSIVPSLKRVPRAVAKMLGDNQGDVTKLKDLLRGTIEVQNPGDAAAVVDQLRARYGEPIKNNNHLDPNQPAPFPNGYRDLNSVWRVNGVPTEVQVNLPEMLAAKDKAHDLYAEWQAIDRKLTREGRNATPQEQARIDELNRQQAAIYKPAWAAAMARLNSGSETNVASSMNREPDARIGVPRDQSDTTPPPFENDQGLPSTRPNLVSGGNDWEAAMRRMNSSRGTIDASSRNIEPEMRTPDGHSRQTYESSVASRPSGSTPNIALGENAGSEGTAARPDASSAIASTSKEIVTRPDDDNRHWEPFPPDSGTLGIPRNEMPQIKDQDRENFLGFLKSRGIGNAEATVPARSLHPTQAEFSPEMVDRFARTGPIGERRVLVSSDGYVLDGHHQFLAQQRLGTDVPVIRLDAPIRELLDAAHAFPDVQRSAGAEPEAAPDEMPRASTLRADDAFDPDSFGERTLGRIDEMRRTDDPARIGQIVAEQNADAQRVARSNRGSGLPDTDITRLQRVHAEFAAEVRAREHALAEGDDRTETMFSRDATDTSQVVRTANVPEITGPAEGLFHESNAWYREHLQGHATRAPDGAWVRFSDKGRSKALSTGRRDARRAAVVRRLPELVRRAPIVETAADRKGRAGVSYAYAGVPVRIGGHTYAVRMVYRVAQDGGRRFYDFRGFDIADPGALVGGRDAGASLGVPGSPGSGFTVGQLRDAFKGDVRFSRDANDRATSDLFDAPTQRERIAAAQRAKDAQRNGQAGGHEDAGDDSLFDGQRPEQTDLAGPRRSQETKPARAKFDATQVREAAAKAWGNRFIKKLERAGHLEFLTSDELVARRDSEGRPIVTRDGLVGTKGVYRAKDGKAYIVTDHIRDLNQVAGTVLHEAGLHYGYDRLTTETDRQVLRNRVNRAVARGDADVIRAWKHAEEVGTPANALHEETMAYLAEHNPGHGIVTRLLDAVKRGLNRAGIPMDLLASDSDAIRMMARDSLRRAAETKKPSRVRVDENGTQDWRASEIGGVPVFSRDTATREAYDKRIDELFGGAKPNQQGVRLLDRGDVLDLAGYGDMPVVLNERHAVVEGADKHPLPKAAWKKMPEWIDNPALVFDRTSDGHLTMIGPELVDGRAVVIGITPSALPTGRVPKGDRDTRHLVLTAYTKDNGTLPLRRRVEEGSLKPVYADQNKTSKFYMDSGVQFPGSAAELRRFNGSLKTDRDLVKYRTDRDSTKFSRDLLGDDDSPEARVRRDAMAARGSVLSQLAADGIPQGAIGWDGNPNNYGGWYGFAGNAMQKLADRFDPVKRVQNAIKDATHATIGDEADAYMLQNLSQSKSGDRLRQFDKRIAKPLMQAMVKAKISPELLQDFRTAQHAEERNAHIAKINKHMPDAGIGFTTKEAKEFLAGNADGIHSGERVTAKNREALESLSHRLDGMRNFTLDTMQASGQLSSEMTAKLRSMFKFYAPVRGKVRDVDQPEMPTRDKHRNGSKNPIQHALGRGEGNIDPGNMLGEMLGDAQRAIINAGNIKVHQAILKLASEHPNKAIWEVQPVDPEYRFSEATGEVYLGFRKPTNDDDVLVVMHKGRAYNVRLIDPRVADAVKNLSAEKGEALVKWLGILNRWLSAAYTRYSPGFIPINALRDAVLGFTGLSAEHGHRVALRAVKLYFPAMRAMWRDDRAVPPGRENIPAEKMNMDDFAREASAHGMRTDIADWKEPEDIQQQLQREFERGMVSMYSIRSHPRAAVGKVLHGLRVFPDAIERTNNAVENAMRLAGYTALRKEGMGAERAAIYAKDLTVNFNRHGTWGPALNSLFLFYNASVQGMRRSVQLMRNPKVAGFLGALAALQASQTAILMAQVGPDGLSTWDKIPEYVKNRALIIALGNGKYFALPMPYEFGFITYAGGRLTQFGLQHTVMPADPSMHGNVVNDLMSGFMQSFSPIPINEGWIGLVPQPVRIPVQVYANKNNFDHMIYNDHPNSNYKRPRASDVWPGTAEPYVKLAQAMNKLGGGDAYTPPKIMLGLLDWSPNQLEFLFDSMVGGMGTFGSRTWGTTTKALAGSYKTTTNGETDVQWSKLLHDMPVLRRFGWSVDESRARSKKFFDIADDFERTHARARDQLNEGNYAKAGNIVRSAGVLGDGITIRVSRSGRPITTSQIVGGKDVRVPEIGNVPGSLADAYNEVTQGVSWKPPGAQHTRKIQLGLQDYSKLREHAMTLPAVQREKEMKAIQDARSGLMDQFLQFYEARKDAYDSVNRAPNPVK